MTGRQRVFFTSGGHSFTSGDEHVRFGEKMLPPEVNIAVKFVTKSFKTNVFCVFRRFSLEKSSRLQRPLRIYLGGESG